MKKIGIFYGSTTGTTEDVAEGIAKRLGVDKKDIHNVDQLGKPHADDHDPGDHDCRGADHQRKEYGYRGNGNPENNRGYSNHSRKCHRQRAKDDQHDQQDL